MGSVYYDASEAAQQGRISFPLHLLGVREYKVWPPRGFSWMAKPTNNTFYPFPFTEVERINHLFSTNVFYLFHFRST